MNILKTISDRDIFPGKDFSEVSEWSERKTVKIILLNDKNEIALVTNPIHNFYLLPGGGIEEGEDIFVAANREVQEEVGFSIREPKLIGSVEEFRSRDMKHYVTTCISAQAGSKIEQDLRTEEEKENGLVVEWFTLSDALILLEKQVAKQKEKEIPFYNTSFNIVRDHFFVDRFNGGF